MKGNKMPHFQDTHPWNQDAKPGTPSYRRWQHNPRENSTIRIMRTLVGEAPPFKEFLTEVSTVCLGLNSPINETDDFRSGDSYMIFETTVFGSTLSGYTTQASILTDAIINHDRVVKMVIEEEKANKKAEEKSRSPLQRIVSWMLYGVDFRK